MPHQKGIKPVAQNKKAYHEYFVEETYECGLSLKGTEVKSMRQGRVNLKESFCMIRNNEVFAEDTLFSAMYLLHTHKIAALSKPYVYYVQRGDSLMGMKKPKLAWRLMTLSVRLWEYARETGRFDEIKNVLPVLCYDKLITKGIRLDPKLNDVYAAMEEYRGNETMKHLLRALISPMPLAMYTLKTHKGIRTQIRARLFALRWLRGNVKGAVSLVQGREDTP